MATIGIQGGCEEVMGGCRDTETGILEKLMKWDSTIASCSLSWSRRKWRRGSEYGAIYLLVHG